MPNALLVEGLWWRYPTFSDKPNPWTLRDINLSIEQGECFGITGPSGAGKTTLCRTLIGILPHSAHLPTEQLLQYARGSVSLLGEQVNAGTASTHKIGMVLQDPENQFLRMSLLHELGLGLQIQGIPNDEILQRAYDALRWVGLEQLWRGASYLHPADLSGGQKQRVAIAAFLALRPQILILDEPTSDLDPMGKREIIETLARLRRDYHMTVILVEQDPDILSTFCDRIALLHEGQVELVAPPPVFYAQRNLLERCGASAGELTRIAWRTGHMYESRPPLTLDEGEVAFYPVLERNELRPCGRGVSGNEVSSSHDKHTCTISNSLNEHEAVVQAEDVYYNYEDGTSALQGIDLSLYRGEMLALLGPNGSGKTTLAKILAGIYRPTGGRVLVLGQNTLAKGVRRQLVRSVGYVFQNPDHQLFCRKVRDEIEYGLKNLGIDTTRRRKIVAETLEAVDLAQYADEDPLFLSKGQRQRLAVAAALAMGPDILVVDEPTTGQDSRSISSIMHLLCELQRQGKAILIITHDMTLVAENCQRAVAFRDGRLAFNGTPTTLFTDIEVLNRTGLRPPTAAALTARIHARQRDFPPLITVEQWYKALKEP